MDGSGGGLGSASGSIELDASGALRALTSVTTGLKNLDSQSRSQGQGLLAWASSREQSLNTIGKGLMGVGATFLGAFGLATKTAMDFDAQISAVGSVAGASQEQLSALREEALRLGADTSLGATEAASAMEIMLKAGASLESVLNGGAEAAINLSEATGVDITLASETAAAAMNTFGVSAEEAADTIAQSANASALDVNDWMLALKTAGPVAAALGFDMEDLAQAMVILGDSAITGEVAATALRNILLGISDPAGEGATALQEWGVATHDAAGNMRSLEEITHDLAGSWDTMSQAQKVALAEQVAGKDGVAAFMAIMDAQTEAVKNNSDAFQDASTRMDATGTVSEQAAARMDNLKGSIEQMKGTVETLMITFVSGLSPALRTVVDGITGLLQRVLALPDGVKTAIAAVVGITGALATAAGGFLLLLPRIAETRAALQALGGVRGIVTQLGTALRGLIFSPVFLVAMAGFAAYKTNFLGFGDAVRRVVSEVKNFTRGFTDAFRTLQGNPLERVLRSIQAGLAAIGGENTPAWIANLARAFGDAATIVGRVTDTFQQFRERGLSPVQAALAALQAVIPGLGTVIAPIRQMVENLGDAFRAFRDGNFGDAFESLGRAAGNLGSAIMAAARAIDWGSVGSALLDGLRSLIGWVAGFVLDLGSIVVSVAGWIAGWMPDVWAWLRDTAIPAIGAGIIAIPSVLVDVVNWARGVIPDIWGWLKGIVLNGTMGDGTGGATYGGSGIPLTDVLVNIANWAKGTIADIYEAIKGWIEGQLSGRDWSNIGTTVGNGIRNAIRDGIQNAASIFATILSWISDQVRAVSWESVGSLFAELLIGGIKGIVGLVGLAGWLLGQVLLAIVEVDWSSVGSAFKTFLETALTAITGFLTGFWKTIQSEIEFQLGLVPWSSIGDKVKGWASDIWNGITDALQPILDAAVGMLNALIDKLNMIPGVNIPKIGGIEQVGTDADAAREKVVNLQSALNSLATGGIMRDVNGPSSPPGGSDYADPYRPHEGGNSNVEYRNFDGSAIVAAFSGVRNAALEASAAVNLSGSALGAVVSLSPAVTAFGTQSTASFLSSGSAAQTGLSPIAPLASGMAAALIGSTLPAFAGVAAGAATNFATMLGAVSSNTAAASIAAATNAASMNTSFVAQASGMNVKSAAQMVLMAASAATNFSAMQTGASTAGSRMAQEMTSGATSALNGVRSALSQIPGIISGIGGSAAATAYGIGANISNSFASGMRSALGSIQASAAAMVAAADTALRARASIASPSKLFTRLGAYIGEGFELGIRSMIPDAARAAAALVNLPGIAGNAYGTTYAPAYAYASPAGGNVTHITNHYVVNALKSDELVNLIQHSEFAYDVTTILTSPSEWRAANGKL